MNDNEPMHKFLNCRCTIDFPIEFHVSGRQVPNPVDKQQLADARFDLRFQEVLHSIIKYRKGGQ